MAAGQYSFTLEQGSTLNFDLEYSGSDGAAIDLTGFESRMHIREQKDSNNIICTLSSTLDVDKTGLNMTPFVDDGMGQGTVYPKSAGKIQVFISAASSSNFSFTKAYYDLEIYSGSNYPIVNRILEGKIKLNKEVTR
jgi:hypothetical protein|tara:strand:- start:14 stop:424 length:411 start_codon:yes stop_codon:yes gene_type:complete